jgi:hypothetical protein
MRPFSVMNCTWQSRWLGGAAVPAFGTADERVMSAAG